MQIHHTTTTRRSKRTRIEQAKDMFRLHYDYKMGYAQIADKYNLPCTTVASAITVHQRRLKKMGLWYPKRHDVLRKVMREAYMEGFNVKQIAGYFKVSLQSVYYKLNVSGLKAKMKQAA